MKYKVHWLIDGLVEIDANDADTAENIIKNKFHEIEIEQGIKIGLHRSRVGDVYRAEEYHQRFFEKNNYF